MGLNKGRGSRTPALPHLTVPLPRMVGYAAFLVPPLESLDNSPGRPERAFSPIHVEPLTRPLRLMTARVVLQALLEILQGYTVLYRL